MKYPKLERSSGHTHRFIQSTGHYVTVTTDQIKWMLEQAEPKAKPRKTRATTATEGAEGGG